MNNDNVSANGDYSLNTFTFVRKCMPDVFFNFDDLLFCEQVEIGAQLLMLIEGTTKGKEYCYEDIRVAHIGDSYTMLQLSELSPGELSGLYISIQFFLDERRARMERNISSPLYWEPWIMSLDGVASVNIGDWYDPVVEAYGVLMVSMMNSVLDKIQEGEYQVTNHPTSEPYIVVTDKGGHNIPLI